MRKKREKICKNCEEVFTYKRSDQLYCCRQCSDEYNNARKAAKVIPIQVAKEYSPANIPDTIASAERTTEIRISAHGQEIIVILNPHPGSRHPITLDLRALH